LNKKTKLYELNYLASSDDNSVFGLDFFSGKYISFNSDKDSISWGDYIIPKAVFERAHHHAHHHKRHPHHK